MDELKDRITFSEFLEWLEFLKWEEERMTKQDIYLAQISLHVVRSQMTTPGKVKLKDFLLTSEQEILERKDRMTKSKTAWFSAVGMKVEQN